MYFFAAYFCFSNSVNIILPGFTKYCSNVYEPKSLFHRFGVDESGQQKYGTIMIWSLFDSNPYKIFSKLSPQLKQLKPWGIVTTSGGNTACVRHSVLGGSLNDNTECQMQAVQCSPPEVAKELLVLD